MNKTLAIVFAIAIITSGSFFGGMKYEQSKSSIKRQGIGNVQARGTGQRASGRGTGGQFITGDILRKDDTGITISVLEGGSKLIFLSASSTISKISNGTVNDLIVGSRVIVGGTMNNDGSVTAQSIQLRPAVAGGNPDRVK